MIQPGKNSSFKNVENDNEEIEKHLKKWNYGALVLNWLWAFAHGQWVIGAIFLSMAIAITILTADIVITFLRTRHFPNLIIDITVIVLLIAERIIAIYLGIRGNRLAWNSGRFNSFEEFEATESAWHRWAERIIVVLTIFVILAIGFITIMGPSIFIELSQDPVILITVLTAIVLVFIMPFVIVQRLRK